MWDQRWISGRRGLQHDVCDLKGDKIQYKMRTGTGMTVFLSSKPDGLGMQSGIDSYNMSQTRFATLERQQRVPIETEIVPNGSEILL